MKLTSNDKEVTSGNKGRSLKRKKLEEEFYQSQTFLGSSQLTRTTQERMVAWADSLKPEAAQGCLTDLSPAMGTRIHFLTSAWWTARHIPEASLVWLRVQALELD